MKYYLKAVFFISTLSFMAAAAGFCVSENESSLKKAPLPAVLTVGEVFQSEHSLNPLSRPEPDASTGETPAAAAQ